MNDPVAARALLPGEHFAQRHACGVVLRILCRKTLQLGQRLWIEGFVAAHRLVILWREARGRCVAVEQRFPGRQRRRNVSAARLLASQRQRALRNLGHLFGIIQRLQAAIIWRDVCQPRAPLRRRLQIAVLLRPQGHQVERLGVIGIDHQHLFQRLARQIVVGFFVPVVGLVKQRLQRRLVLRRLRGAAKGQHTGKTEDRL
ncbi:hypothetical protein D3C72_731150 [compost metagenome]